MLYSTLLLVWNIKTTIDNRTMTTQEPNNSFGNADDDDPIQPSHTDSDSEEFMEKSNSNKKECIIHLATTMRGKQTRLKHLQSRWDDMFARLLLFKNRHRHVRVPNRYEQDPALGHWVSTQRRHVRFFVPCKRNTH